MYDLVEVLGFVDLEGRLAQQQLVGHDTDRPKIDLLVVSLALEDLGGEVEGGSAVGTA
jgi:hypothetical protein